MNRGFVQTRTKAQALIMSGSVLVADEVVDKAGTAVSTDASIEIRGKGDGWVSRGAHKLLRGLDAFAVDPQGAVCLDVGASTGGFTHVLLSRDASLVYAVDVGYGQLHWTLRQDPRVVVMERTNARSLLPSSFDPLPTLAVMDASFISIRLILPVLEAVLPSDATVVTLVKPQFEAGRNRIGKGGVVRSAEVHRAVLGELHSFLSENTSLGLMGCVPSPIRGPKGNVEFLFHLVKGVPSRIVDLDEPVREAHEGLLP